MLNSDFFMAFDVGTGFGDCNIDPINTCRRSNTFDTVSDCCVARNVLIGLSTEFDHVHPINRMDWSTADEGLVQMA